MAQDMPVASTVEVRRRHKPSGRTREQSSPHAHSIIAACSDQNARRRRRMEDCHVMLTDYHILNSYNEREPFKPIYLALFDGHGGRAAADWCGEHLHEYLATVLQEEWMVSEGRRSVMECMDVAFMKADEQLTSEKGIYSGCTAVVCLILQEDDGELALYSANVGDARAVLFRQDRALRLTFDHKASDPGEQKRVQECGGFINNDRVSGMLAITRSLGDSEMKDFVSGRPFVTRTCIDDSDQVMVIACDGLWDVVGDQEACEMTMEQIGENPSAESVEKAAEFLVDLAIERGSCDNITVMICRFIK